MILKSISRWLLLVLILGLVSCTTSFQNDSQGLVMMRNYINEESSIRGVQPLDMGENAEIIQDSFPGTLDELLLIVMEQTNLDSFPEAIGSYKGGNFKWDLYSFDAQIEDAGPQPLKVDFALAEGESRFYFVALVAIPEDYEQNAEKYRTVFLHTIYALSPLD
jgi:hypothetical protein